LISRIAATGQALAGIPRRLGRLSVISLIMQFAVGTKSYFQPADPSYQLPDEYFGYFRRVSSDGSHPAGRITEETKSAVDHEKFQLFQPTQFR
jgi:hypothetical protein